MVYTRHALFPNPVMRPAQQSPIVHLRVRSVGNGGAGTSTGDVRITDFVAVSCIVEGPTELDEEEKLMMILELTSVGVNRELIILVHDIVYGK